MHLYLIYRLFKFATITAYQLFSFHTTYSSLDTFITFKQSLQTNTFLLMGINKTINSTVLYTPSSCKHPVIVNVYTFFSMLILLKNFFIIFPFVDIPCPLHPVNPSPTVPESVYQVINCHMA